MPEKSPEPANLDEKIVPIEKPRLTPTQAAEQDNQVSFQVD